VALYKIGPHDCTASIAKKFGFKDWKTIYDHPSNLPFRNKHPNPNVIHAGDVINIPDKETKGVGAPHAAKHRFSAKGRRTKLRLVIEDFDGAALGGKDYLLRVGPEDFKGKTGGDGLVEQAVLADAEQGEITVWLDGAKTQAIFWPLEIGALRPLDTVAGIQGRLANLGYNIGRVTGVEDKQTGAAVAAFRTKQHVSESGAVGSKTRNELKKVYGF
jgi:hypothetical protein